MRLTSDRRYDFAVDPDALWRVLAATDEYRKWWPWLHGFAAAGLVSGDSWRCVVRPPLPYTLRFTLELDEVVAPSFVRATVHGDIAGTAALTMAPTAEGTNLRLVSDLASSSRAFGVISTVFRPLVTRAHDWVLDNGAAQFADRAIAAERSRDER
ncbi:MAG: hypothetical protein H0W46_07130 [Acidimicrobiia bacterium]|nr:hypothetical protein [Acidimicrobiia bacterium]